MVTEDDNHDIQVVFRFSRMVVLFTETETLATVAGLREMVHSQDQRIKFLEETVQARK